MLWKKQTSLTLVKEGCEGGWVIQEQAEAVLHAGACLLTDCSHTRPQQGGPKGEKGRLDGR